MKAALSLLALTIAVPSFSCGSGFGSATGPILGTWERKNSDGSVRDRWIFKSDGTFNFDEISNPPESQDHVTGRFGVSGDYLNGSGTNAKDGKSANMRTTFFANATRMCIGALIRQGSGAGIVGTYFGEQTGTASNGTPINLGIRVEVRANNTATVTTSGSENATREATWEDKGGGVYKVRFGSGGITISTDYTLMDDRALCNPVYQRAS